jgi:hypothetical protein
MHHFVCNARDSDQQAIIAIVEQLLCFILDSDGKNYDEYL